MLSAAARPRLARRGAANNGNPKARADLGAATGPAILALKKRDRDIDIDIDIDRDVEVIWGSSRYFGVVTGLMGFGMACYGGLQRLLTGLTKSTEHPNCCFAQCSGAGSSHELSDSIWGFMCRALLSEPRKSCYRVNLPQE